MELLLVERSIVQSTNSNTQEYPEIPESKKIPENTRPYISTLLPDPNPNRYPVFFPIPDPIRYWKTVELLRAAIYHGGWYTTYINQHWVQRRTIDMSISTSPIMQHHKIWPLFILIVRENAAYQISCISVEFWPNNEDIRHLNRAFRRKWKCESDKGWNYFHGKSLLRWFNLI